MNPPRKSLWFFACIAAVIVCCTENTQANTATWKFNPDSGDWNNANNWSAGGPPNSASDTAFFSASKQTKVFLSTVTEVSGITFNSDAGPYTVTSSADWSLTISGAGITNNSGNEQKFVSAVDEHGARSAIVFTNSATIGTSVMLESYGGSFSHAFGASIVFFNTASAGGGYILNRAGTANTAFGGRTEFVDSASAGDANFTNGGAAFEGAEGGQTVFGGGSNAATATFITNGGTVDGAKGGVIQFLHTANAAHGNFTTNGGTTSGALGGVTQFFFSATAGDGIFQTNGGATAGQTAFYATSSGGHAQLTSNGSSINGGLGGVTAFFDNATADSATLTANGGQNGGKGGTILFGGDSIGGTARVEVFGNGSLNIESHNLPGLTVGSIEGDGKIFLGAKTLTTGSNNLNTNFSGVIEGLTGGGGFQGSLNKIGSGTLMLSGANTYSGPTTVNAGKLIVNGSITSAVTVNGGSLGGSGTTEAIIVNQSGVLSPGNSPGILNVSGNLRLALGSTYLVDLNGNAVGKEYDQTNVVGVVTLDGATLSLNLGFTPVPGSEFTIINNDSGDMVIGTFDGLSEGAMFESGGQAFTISYRGGDGNDVVLETVPEPQVWILAVAGFIALIAVRKRIA
jgi:fibronectin-binding autotransporter adhesin